MNILLFISCSIPIVYCLPTESFHNVYRRDVSELFNKENQTHYNKDIGPITSPRSYGERSLSRFSDIQRSYPMNAPQSHPSRTYLPPENEASRHSYATLDHNVQIPSTVNYNSKLGFQSDRTRYNIKPITEYPTQLQSQTPQIFDSNPRIHQTDLNTLSHSVQIPSTVNYNSKFGFQSDHSRYNIKPITEYPTQVQPQIPQIFNSNPPNHQTDLNALLALRYAHLNQPQSHEKQTPDKHNYFAQNNLIQKTLNTPYQSQFPSSFNSYESEQSTAHSHKNAYGLNHPTGFPTTYSSNLQPGVQNFPILHTTSPSIYSFNDSILRDYGFQYNVAVEGAGPEFGHEEERKGEVARGQYKVLLPDGRTQIVQYEADAQGFRPKVSYEGRSYYQDTFQQQDPLSRTNINTIVTDLLNTDVKRTRNQKATYFNYSPQQQFVRNDDANNYYIKHVFTETSSDRALEKLPGFKGNQHYQISQTTRSQTTNPYAKDNLNISSDLHYSPSSSDKHPFHAAHLEKQPVGGNADRSLSPLHVTEHDQNSFLQPHTHGIGYSQSYANSNSNLHDLPHISTPSY